MPFDKLDAASAGFDARRLEMVRGVIDEGLERELYTGAAMWASRRGVDAFLRCAGHTDSSRTSPVGPRTLFDLASLTKPVVTAPLLMMLVADGRLDLRQGVSEFFPDRDTEHLRGVTLFHLVTHISGLPAWRDLYSQSSSRADVVNALLGVPLESEPGTKYQYSCLGYIILGLIVESVSGESLDLCARRRIFQPLGMTDTMYNPDHDLDVVFTGDCQHQGKELKARVHDENACALGGISGNAGLFSTVQDLATFCHTITFASQSSELMPAGPAIRDKIFSNAIAEQLGGHTLGGWFIWPNPLLPAGDLVTKATIGHSGFTGTAIIVDPLNEVCSVLLTNRVCRADDGAQFRTLRRRTFNALLGAIVW